MASHVGAPDVLVIGAGAMGAAIAWFAAQLQLSVVVVERGAIVSGTTSACEGNLLLSDKEPGAELDLALLSYRIWQEELREHDELWEFEEKGGLVVAMTEAGASNLVERTLRQRGAGIDARLVDLDELPELEPYLTRDVAGAAFYPQDCQVQPMLMTAHFLRLARARGAQVRTGTTVVGLLRNGDRVVGVQTDRGEIPAGNVVNAAGPWASVIADMAGVPMPVMPRRGVILVTEPLPPTVRHKVYSGEYVESTQSSDEGLQVSTVIEGTQSGTVLIGSSRERVGFDAGMSPRVLREIARSALAVFPTLASTAIMRGYLGFRPYCPDHLPVIGPDPRAPGLFHASGHEGAGIGLSVGTARLVAQALVGERTDLDLAPFAPDRFDTREDL